MPLISVIIPCYNQGIYIDDAVESVLKQSFQDFEIIIINDGSDDEITLNKLRNYSKPKTKIIHTENKGSSSARNIGFKESSGEFIQFLDADDIILPSKFDDQLSIFFSDPSVGICYSDFNIFDTRKQLYLKAYVNNILSKNPLEDFLFRWERGLGIPIHSALFKKSIWGADLPFSEELKAEEDWFMWCNLALKNVGFRYIDKKLAIYRHHGSNKTKDIKQLHHSFFLASYLIMQIIPVKYKLDFSIKSIEHIYNSISEKLHPDLMIRIADLKQKFAETDKSIDYRIGHFLLKPYRLFKTILFGKRYI